MHIIVSIPAELRDAERKTTAEVLRKGGWVEESLGRPGPTFSHPEVKSEGEARTRLLAANLSPDLIHIESYPDDEWDSFDLI
jgi:hypothetical protein